MAQDEEEWLTLGVAAVLRQALGQFGKNIEMPNYTQGLDNTRKLALDRSPSLSAPRCRRLVSAC